MKSKKKKQSNNITKKRTILRTHVNRRIRISGKIKIKFVEKKRNGILKIGLCISNVTSPNLNKRLDHLNLIITEEALKKGTTLNQIRKRNAHITFTAVVEKYKKANKEKTGYITNYGVKQIKNVEITNKPKQKPHQIKV